MSKQLALFTLFIACLLLNACSSAQPGIATDPTVAPPTQSTMVEEVSSPEVQPTTQPVATEPIGEASETITGIVQAEMAYNHASVPPTYDIRLELKDGTFSSISIPDSTLIQLASGQRVGTAEALRQCMAMSVIGQMQGENLVAEQITILEVPSLPVGQIIGRIARDSLELRPNPDAEVSLATLTPTSNVSVRGRCGEWLQLTTAENQSGWVHRSDMDLIESAIPTVPLFPETMMGDFGMGLPAFTLASRVTAITGYQIAIEPTNGYSSIEIDPSTPIIFPDGHRTALAQVRPGAQVEVTGYDVAGTRGPVITADRIVILQPSPEAPPTPTGGD